MEFAFDGGEPGSPDTTPLMEKYYTIYRNYYIKHGREWARQVKEFEKRRKIPFGKVNREVNSAMRRYLGGDGFAKYIDTLEYMILREGLLIKDENNNLDIVERTFNDWML